jgi:osmotically-inducible protein OsmY
MGRQERFRNDDRRYRDDQTRDWRVSGDDWRRGENFRSGRRFGENDWADYGGSMRDRDYRDYQDQGGSYGASDEMRRRDIGGYGGANRDPYRGDYGFASSESDRYGRPGGTYGPGTYESGRGSSFYDRDDAWRRGDDWPYSRGGRSGWDDDRRWSGRGDERGFFERASDEVASWFGDRDAERRRMEDQYRGRGPKGYMRSDDRIREDVNDRLTDAPTIDASEIEVAVSNGEVTLTGFVFSRDQRRRAEDVAETVSGVSHVQNNLRVRERTGNLGQTAFGRDTSTGAPGTEGTSGTATSSEGSSTSTTSAAGSSGRTGRKSSL